jgi:aspartate ammonia-lyase
MESATFRNEHDFLGDRQIPASALYGIQTLRALENFNITGLPVSREPLMIK